MRSASVRAALGLGPQCCGARGDVAQRGLQRGPLAGRQAGGEFRLEGAGARHDRLEGRRGPRRVRVSGSTRRSPRCATRLTSRRASSPATARLTLALSMPVRARTATALAVPSDEYIMISELEQGIATLITLMERYLR